MRRAFACFFLLLLTTACTEARNAADERAYRAEQGKGEIILGAAGPWTTEAAMLQQGIQLAVDEINSGGGVLGRRLRVVWRDDQASVDQGKIIAQEFASDLNLVAVIGHYNSYVSIPTSIIYEINGLLMFSPTSTVSRLTRQGSRLVFRNIPTDTDFGKQIADIAFGYGYQRVMIYYVRNEHGMEVTDAFEKQAIQLGLAIVDRRPYDPSGQTFIFREDIEEWKSCYDFDVIFVVGTCGQVASFVSLARQLGVMEPIIGGDGLDSPLLLKIGGKGAEGMIVATSFSWGDKDPETVKLDEAFQAKYHTLPNSAAAQGYDAVRLLAYAMQKAGTTVPAKVAEALRSTKNWHGATGRHTFDEYGDVVNKEIDIVIVRNGNFEYYDTSRPR